MYAADEFFRPDERHDVDRERAIALVFFSDSAGDGRFRPVPGGELPLQRIGVQPGLDFGPLQTFMAAQVFLKPDFK